ncbi:MAG: cupin domain-containing protein [Phycisphaeraceae bacterium]|nr:MAG: cupin domain-containing protein [Phycisphaeraceae bacterium]
MNEPPTAAANRSYALAPGEGEHLDVVGSTVRVLAGSRESRGGVFLFELTAPPDNGPPLHTHRDEDELFFLIEGLARFVVDGTEFTLGPGGFAYAARGSVHTWKAIGPSHARILILCTPAAGLEHAFRETDALTRAGQASPHRLTSVFESRGVPLVGPPL